MSITIVYVKIVVLSIGKRKINLCSYGNFVVGYMDAEEWRWQFRGFKSEGEGCPVQDWFNSLDPDQQLDLVTLCEHLSRMTDSRWRLPEYDPLDGEEGISEIRSDFRGDQGMLYARVYGIQGWREHPRAYIFLHGTNKRVRNDAYGKAIARRRLGELEREEATTHEFDFQAGFSPNTEAEPGGEGAIR